MPPPLTDCGGTIVETESYERDDPACHAFVGLTERTEVLFGPPGRAYVYLSYGIHSLLNFVCEPEGDAAAVLIRALEPTDGLRQMRARRGGRPDLDLCSGPGKLTEAWASASTANGAASADPFLLLAPEPSWRPEVVTSPRVGITKAVERPWRFCASAARSSPGLARLAGGHAAARQTGAGGAGAPVRGAAGLAASGSGARVRLGPIGVDSAGGGSGSVDGGLGS